MNPTQPAAPQRYAPLLLLTLLGFGVRLAFLGRQSLWYDEAFSLAVASAPWEVFWSALLSDGVHPPGYYLLLRAALPLFGGMEFGLRFLSAAAGTLAVPLLARLARCLFRREEAGLLAALLLALNPFAIWYAQEARQYALLLALTLAAGWTYLRLLNRPSWRRWWPFTLVTALSFLLHYFAFVFVLAQFVHLIGLLRRRPIALRWWFAAQAVAAAPFLPWAVAIAGREGRNFGIGWIQPVSPLDPLLTLSNLGFALSDPASVWTWLGVVVVLSSQFSVFGSRFSGFGSRFSGLSSRFSALKFRGSTLHPSSFILIFLLTPILFTFLLSFRLPLYVDRFLIVSLPALLLGLVGGTMVSSPAWLRRGTMLVLVATTALAGGRLFVDPALTKEDWRAAAAYVEAAERAGDLLAMRQFQDRIPFAHYYRGDLPLAIITTNRQTTPPAEIAAGAKRLWVVQRRPFAPTHALAGSAPLRWTEETEPAVRDWYRQHAAGLMEERSFPGVYLLLFNLEKP